MRLHLIVALALALPVLSAPIAAQDLDKSVIHIVCTGPDGVSRPGTGVVISSSGMVLTAKHVVIGKIPAGAVPTLAGITCRGSSGHAGLPPRDLTIEKLSVDYDAAVLNYPDFSGADPLGYCDIEPRHLGAQIIATGFPLRSQTGRPSKRAGILSTTQPSGVGSENPGTVESDAATTRGMSGGQVTLVENGQLIGIVAGEPTDSGTGLVVAYSVLVASRLKPEFESFGLTTDPAKCAERKREISWPPEGKTWTPADGPQLLGMKEKEGYCFLTRVWGKFDHPEDSVAITLMADEEYQLIGKDGFGEANHGAEVKCVRF